jgi:hypothetical protein
LDDSSQLSFKVPNHREYVLSEDVAVRHDIWAGDGTASPAHDGGSVELLLQVDLASVPNPPHEVTVGLVVIGPSRGSTRHAAR